MNKIYAFIDQHRLAFWRTVIGLNILAAIDNVVNGQFITGTVFIAIAVLVYMYRDGNSL